MIFLGLLDISKKNVVLAVIAGITQYIQASILTSYNKPRELKEGETRSMQEEFTNSMQTQMKYFLPIMIGFIGMSLPAALPLYWSVRNIFTAFQEFFVRGGLKK